DRRHHLRRRARCRCPSPIPPASAPQDGARLDVATLTDTGPLVALVDAGEPEHETCRRALDRVSSPMLTTWPVFTEAMHLLGDAGGWLAQRVLWQMRERRALDVADLEFAAVERARSLMEKYRDTPMDLADATLVALAEARGI